MNIKDDHMYHGAALIQVAEHESFTDINSLKVNGNKNHNTYKINDEIGLYLKYASKETEPHNEYGFTFSAQQLKDLIEINKTTSKLFIALICVKSREICCLEYSKLLKLIRTRKKVKKAKENQYIILVTVPEGKSLRVYINAPDVKNTMLGEKIIPRNAFPEQIFN
ncbi:MAG: hypothetical protein GQ529_08785 [Methyloprofundus sp.]|nr:hypothetical protein [Methyloprofundus sp.]